MSVGTYENVPCEDRCKLRTTVEPNLLHHILEKSNVILLHLECALLQGSGRCLAGIHG
jgi:hypothetical protein